MRKLREIKNRVLVAGMSGMLICMLTLGAGESEPRMSLAWWGFLYPEYCFMEFEELKISFWLAKVFDW